MKAVISELRKIVKKYAAEFRNVGGETLSIKTVQGKWSKKEVIGHLIDSAHNNLRRFISGQTEKTPHIVYEQNFWVEANDYQNMPAEEVILLWEMMNKRICVVLENMNSENYANTVNTGKTETDVKTLHWLAEDYVKHLKHHINQVMPGEFEIIYQ